MTIQGLFLVSAGVLFYVYVGYPLILQLVVWIRGARSVRRGPDLPRVSLVISAHNEEAVIGAKLRNALALDYPPELLEIAVVSDASSDGTDAIVGACADPRVRLVRQQERRGKTAGLNAVVPTLSGEIVVFSDANAIYDPQALRKLVRNFADPEVGCVTGEARYLSGDRSTAAVSERAYWNYEIWIKRLETAVGSMVGGDGAIYAIRKPLWQPLPEDAINDFLNPLQIVSGGGRAIYEPEAICYEETAGGVRREWRRRVRIVGRSWRAVFQASGVLNPMRVGIFAFCLISHKLLRWFSGLFLAGLLLVIGVAIGSAGTQGALIAAAVAAVIGASLMVGPFRRALGLSFYFAAMTAASLVGLFRGTFGRVSGVWATPRESAADAYLLRPGIPIVLLAIVGFATAVVALAAFGAAAAGVVFWSAVATLGYIYVGYPLLLHSWAAFRKQHVSPADCEPSVCLLIAAHDEAAVIAAKLQNSQRLDYPAARLDIVVASDGSTDGTNDIVRRFAPRVRLLAFEERRGKISAIIEAMKRIGAEVVVLSDANTFLHPDALRKLVRNFADPSVGAVSGDVILTGERAALAESEDLYYRYERHLQKLESQVGSLVGVDGALYAMRRELFVPPPTDTILDDMAIPMGVLRAGYRIIFEDQAVAEEAGSLSASEEFWRKVRVVAGAVQFLLRPDSAVPATSIQAVFTLVSHKALRWMSPALGAVAFAASLVLAPTSLLFLIVVLAECAVLLLGVLGCAPAIRRIGVVALAHYFCLVQAAAALGLFRGLAGRQPVAWRRFQRPTVQTT